MINIRRVRIKYGNNSREYERIIIIIINVKNFYVSEDIN